MCNNIRLADETLEKIKVMSIPSLTLILVFLISRLLGYALLFKVNIKLNKCRFNHLFAVALFGFFCMGQITYANPVVGSVQNSRFRQLDNTMLFFDYHKQTLSKDRQFYTYPHRNNAFVTDFVENEGNSLICYTNSIKYWGVLHSYAFAVSPELGLNYSGDDVTADTIWPGVDGGAYLRGFVDSIDFDLDVRVYEEKHSNPTIKTKGYDIRGHIGFNYAWTRFSLSRDVLHWGPGYYNNLVFNQNAPLYNMVNLELTFGPLHVFSAYANLYEGGFEKKVNERNLYAHRYELAFDGLTLGVSEIQLLYGENKPWLFTPVVPLFIEKGNYTEEVNNGALAIDVNYHFFQHMRLYGEFFLDDMVSPVALYENKYSNNRWAVMFGAQFAYDVLVGSRLLQFGSISEVARIEPYTYCHYDFAPALFAHQGAPLGNPNGPNSLVVDWIFYGKYWLYGKSNVFVGVHNKWKWKGDDNGSDIYDSYKTERKRFARNARLHYSLMPVINFRGEHFGFSGEYAFFDGYYVDVRMMFMM